LALLALVCLGAACDATSRTDGKSAARNDDASQSPSSELPDISGMAPWHPDDYLVVHDTSDPRAPRAGVLVTGASRRPSIRRIPIRDDALPGGPLADLESLAAIPGRPSEFLALESGGPIDGRPSRRLLVHLRLVSGGDEAMELHVVSFTDVLPATGELDNCEGLVCWRHGEELRILIADRGRLAGRGGDKRRDGAQSATVAGSLVLAGETGAVAGATAAMRFTPLADDAQQTIEIPLHAAGPWRACSDLCVDADGALWGACVQDLGASGPFRSRIYRVGEIDRRSGWPRLQPATIVHEVDGLKVEALAPCDLPHVKMCFATDDELYGGVWRPLRSPGRDDVRP
jgi:hypothetical protein